MNPRGVLFGCLLVLFTQGCATVGAEAGPPAEQLPAATPGEVAGEPMHSPDLARDVAELVLAEQGIDCRDKVVKISSLDGIYTITFRAPPADMDESRFEVDIRQANSEVLAVRRVRPKHASRDD
ncbi:MAG TPA: hypothetical protein PK668_27415 [Myxococcota bacterium]|nr:hypothetical protein [Myxococcota bacterium]HRY97257.1 hypothetical protein [Myxococcota bacterium]